MPAPFLQGVVASPEQPPTQAPLLNNPDLMLTFQYMRFLNQHTMDYIRMADAKAAVLITLLSANLLVLVQRAADAIARLHQEGTVFLIVGAIALATISLTVAINVIRPRVFRNHQQGHIFWEDIVAQEKIDYAASFPGLTGKDILRELGEHNHNLASSALRKFRWLRAGFYLALMSIVTSASIILLTTEPLPR
ncbi:MAG: Pycsar system effector family protein [Candidatus Sericytochromatia bacterium]|nr:Pycsar system effector family protein [Candidatus Sericytochromatia bacterium]